MRKVRTEQGATGAAGADDAEGKKRIRRARLAKRVHDDEASAIHAMGAVDDGACLRAALLHHLPQVLLEAAHHALARHVVPWDRQLQVTHAGGQL